MLRQAVRHFQEFHTGRVNVITHVIGFAGIFYSLYTLQWILFALFFIVLEFGHIYNHFMGIKPYDFRIQVFVWRVFIFVAVVLLFFWISQMYQKRYLYIEPSFEAWISNFK